jgi:Peptidase C39 family
MERYLKDSGFRVFALRGEWGDLRGHLVRGRPLIISTEPGSAHAPLHYVVVTGMDWQRGAVFVNDPARGKLLRIERPEFEKEWLAARNWMLLAVPADPSAPLGRRYFLANWEVDKKVCANRFFTVKVGPFVDDGAISDSSGLFGSRRWCWDTGAQCKIRVLGSLTVILSYGRDLRGGPNVFYGTTVH